MLIRLPFVLLVTFVFATALRADVLPFSGAQVAENIAIFHIENEGVRVELEVYPADWEVFAHVVPEDLLPGLGIDKPRPDPNYGGISIERGGGSALPVQFMSAERRKRIDRASPIAGQTDPMTGRRVPAPPSDPEVIFLELFYSFEGDRPKTVVIRPPYNDETPAVAIGFMVYDRSVPVSKFSYLSADAVLKVNWPDPWTSAFSNPNINRTAQNGTTAYLYVAPREIRHEILIRGRELGPWIDQQIETGAKLDASRQAQILDAALDVFGKHNPFSIDGSPADPISVRGAFLTIGERGFQVVEGTPTLDSDSTFVGVILSYPISFLPADASVTWDMFDGMIREVPMTLTDDAGPFLDMATPDDPEVTWTNYLKRYVEPEVSKVEAKGIMTIPVWMAAAIVVAVSSLTAAVIVSNRRLRAGLFVFAVICFGSGFALNGARTVPLVSPFSGQSDGELAASALSSLLANLYVAALEVSPEARSAALMPIVSEETRSDLAAELETNLAIRVPGGGLARVSEISDVVVEEGGMNRNGTFEGVVMWSVDARAGHWGHDHRRRIRYRARAEFGPLNGHWTLAALTVLEARSPDV